MGRWKRGQYYYERKDIEQISEEYTVFLNPCHTVASWSDEVGEDTDWTDILDRKLDFDCALDSIGKRKRWHSICDHEETIILGFALLNRQQKLVMWNWVSDRMDAGVKPILKNPDDGYYRMLKFLNGRRK